MNFSNPNCLNGAPGSLNDPSLATTNCLNIAANLRYNRMLARCGSDPLSVYQACDQLTNCMSVTAACDSVIQSGCYDGVAAQKWCTTDMTMCNTNLVFSPLQGICVLAPSLIGCQGSIDVFGCTVCETMGYLSGGAQPVCASGTIANCSAIADQACHPIDPMFAMSSAAVYPLDFETSSMSCWNYTAPPAPGNGTAGNVTCFEQAAYQCPATVVFSIQCREALALFYSSITCRPCANTRNQYQLDYNFCNTLATCLQYAPVCPGFAMAADGLRSYLPIYCAAATGTGWVPGRNEAILSRVHTGCSNEIVPTPPTMAPPTNPASGTSTTGSGSGSGTSTTGSGSGSGTSTTGSGSGSGTSTTGSGTASTGGTTVRASSTTGVRSSTTADAVQISSIMALIITIIVALL